MEDRYVKFHERGQGRAIIELAKQYHPRDAVREFVTNCVDARVPDTIEDIAVTINPSQRRVVISDNGIGITYENLVALSESIGYSQKAGRTDMRGEKALGLLAFGSLGEMIHIISRPYEGDNSGYGYVRWKIDESKERIPVSPEQLSSSDVERDFYGNFRHGTRIIIDKVNPHVMEKVLTISNLKAWLTSLYNPALRKGIVKIHLGRLSGKRGMKSESLNPIDYERENSSLLMDEVIQISIKGEEAPGDLEVLLYVDPSAAFDKTAVYSKDVLVYESLAELTEFSKSPVWTSGKVSGYINDYFNRLILGRTGIDRNRNAFKAWFKAVQEIEERIRPIVEEKRKHGKKVKEEGLIKEVYDSLTDIWRELELELGTGRYALSKDGETIPVEGAEPAKERWKRKEGISSEPKGRHPGPGTFRYSPEGYPRRVVSKGGIPFSLPQPIEFPPSESRLRSKLEERVGSKVVYLNSTHRDYKSRAELKDNTPMRKYIIELMAKEIAIYQATKLASEGKLMGDKDEVVRNALQQEEHIKFRTQENMGIR